MSEPIRIQRKRSLPEYAVWRMSIFKRDQYTCVLCGAKNRKGQKYVFDADHIRPLAKLFEDHGITTVDEAICCAALWDTNNGRCLCRACHKKTETWGPNTKPRKPRVTSSEPVESTRRKAPRRSRKTAA
jgi:5-methylcytosine-specific restriction endonuclease McrA